MHASLSWWRQFLRYWPLWGGIHGGSPPPPPPQHTHTHTHKGQWRIALVFSLFFICPWTNSWANFLSAPEQTVRQTIEQSRRRWFETPSRSLWRHCHGTGPLLAQATSHYTNLSWLIVNWTLRNKLQRNLRPHSSVFFEENAFRNIVCKMAPTLSRP